LYNSNLRTQSAAKYLLKVWLKYLLFVALQFLFVLHLRCKPCYFLAIINQNYSIYEKN